MPYSCAFLVCNVFFKAKESPKKRFVQVYNMGEKTFTQVQGPS